MFEFLLYVAGVVVFFVIGLVLIRTVMSLAIWTGELIDWMRRG